MGHSDIWHFNNFDPQFGFSHVVDKAVYSSVRNYHRGFFFLDTF